MRYIRTVAGALTAVLALAACDPQPPFSNTTTAAQARGVGFGDYHAYLRAQEELSRIRAQQARQQAAQAQNPVMQVTPGLREHPLQQSGGTSMQGAQGSIGAEAVAALRPGAGSGGAPAAQPGTAPQPQPQTHAQTAGAPLSALAPSVAPGSGGGGGQTAVSDQGFTPAPFGTPQQNRVVRREHVPQVQVDSVPQGSMGPNLFAYALSTNHNVGEERFNRSNPLRWRRFERACAQFRTQDEAQEAFLAAGGPQRDPNHLDPNGDGFACWWDPAPFRQAARAAQLPPPDDDR